jgi:hypothetical protein
MTRRFAWIQTASVRRRIMFSTARRVAQALDAALQSLHGAASDGTPRFRSIESPGKDHATLTFADRRALDRGIDTRDLIERHLHDRLTVPPAVT